MDCYWIKVSPSLNKGITVINQLDENRFEHFIKHIVAKVKLPVTEIFTEDELNKLGKIFNIDQDNLVLSIKTVQYIFKRMLKYIFMPVDLKNDIKGIGLNNEKAETIVKVWSVETRSALDELDDLTTSMSDESINFTWKLNAELSSDYRKKCKIPKAYIALTKKETEVEMELTHSELYGMYLQFESIQNELDSLII